jgi:hypothetical protein
MGKNYAVETVSSLPFGMLIGAPLSAAIDAQSQAAKATIDFIMTVGFMPASAVQPPAAAGGAPTLAPDPDPVDITRPDGVPAANANPATNAGETRMVTFSYSTSNEDATVVNLAQNIAATARAATSAANAATAVQNATGATAAMIAAANAAAALPGATADSVAAAIVTSTNQTATISVPVLSVVPIPFFAIEEMTIDFVAKITEAITESSKASSRTALSASTEVGGGWGPVHGSFKAGLSSTHTSSSERSSKYQTELTMTIHVRASSESMPKGMGKVLDMLAGLIKSQRH